MNAKLKRISAGHYETNDGIFSICKQQNGYDYNQNWFILHVLFKICDQCDQSLTGQLINGLNKSGP
jgi:hypothetical protein